MFHGPSPYPQRSLQFQRSWDLRTDPVAGSGDERGPNRGRQHRGRGQHCQNPPTVGAIGNPPPARHLRRAGRRRLGRPCSPATTPRPWPGSGRPHSPFMRPRRDLDSRRGQSPLIVRHLVRHACHQSNAPPRPYWDRYSRVWECASSNTSARVSHLSLRQNSSPTAQAQCHCPVLPSRQIVMALCALSAAWVVTTWTPVEAVERLSALAANGLRHQPPS